MDHEAYLKRLDFDSPVERGSASTLAALHRQHLLRIPFENLDIALGNPIVLDSRRLYEKIVERRRGGFCYELNGAFAGLLTRLGYTVQRLSARVARDGGGFGIPFDHLCLLVETADGRFLADVGFGDCFHRPLPFEIGKVSRQSAVEYRLTDSDSSLLLESRRILPGAEEPSAFAPRYVFTREERRLEDFFDACEYHQRSPESSFTQNTLVTIARPAGRLTLSGARRIESADHGAQRKETMLHSKLEYAEVLSQDFGFTHAEAERCGVVLADRNLSQHAEDRSS